MSEREAIWQPPQPIRGLDAVSNLDVEAINFITAATLAQPEVKQAFESADWDTQREVIRSGCLESFSKSMTGLLGPDRFKGLVPDLPTHFSNFPLTGRSDMSISELMEIHREHAAHLLNVKERAHILMHMLARGLPMAQNMEDMQPVLATSPIA